MSTSGSTEKVEKLHFGIFQRGVRHVINQRDSHGPALPEHWLTMWRANDFSATTDSEPALRQL